MRDTHNREPSAAESNTSLMSMILLKRADSCYTRESIQNKVFDMRRRRKRNFLMLGQYSIVKNNLILTHLSHTFITRIHNAQRTTHPTTFTTDAEIHNVVLFLTQLVLLAKADKFK